MQAASTFRLHIGIFGRRNVGKSSLLNALTGQQTSIVSDVPGTTTDPVEKAMELLPLGPVTFIDTAGVDDEGALGGQRVERTRLALQRTDVAILVGDGDWTAFEAGLLQECRTRNVAVVAVRNKCDDLEPPTSDWPADLAVVRTSCRTGRGIGDLRQALLRAAPEDFVNRPGILSDLVPPGGCAVLVVPIDKEAPKGRLILPQVQSIRDLLDNDSSALVVKERELRAALDMLSRPPALVVTDSQAFLKVAGDTPDSIPLTSFSVLFARFQGDLPTMVQGALAIDTLRTGDRVLVAEACTHHPIGEDIGTVKIPRWLTQYVGGALDFEFTRGRDLPADLGGFKLVIHCGACMWNRREMLSRLETCRQAGVPVTNYGLAIAFSLGIFERALGPFPGALEAYRTRRR
jgi:[FeFe] hydrogenase H-cluster maturation GTPase HydF